MVPAVAHLGLTRSLQSQSDFRGLAFLYARNRFQQPDSTARWPHLLPVLSAATITLVGATLCFGALKTFG